VKNYAEKQPAEAFFRMFFCSEIKTDKPPDKLRDVPLITGRTGFTDR
jgi:hypothetical protein